MPAKRKCSAAEEEPIVPASSPNSDFGSSSAVGLRDSSSTDLNHDHNRIQDCSSNNSSNNSNNNNNNNNSDNNNNNNSNNSNNNNNNNNNNTAAKADTVMYSLVVSECPFTVEFRSIPGFRPSRAEPAKKRSKSLPHTDGGARGGETLPPQSLPFDGSATAFIVRPDEEWRRLGKYRNFVGSSPLPPRPSGNSF